MTMFEFFESGHALIGFKLGIVNAAHLVKYDIYKEYRSLIIKMPVSEARKKIMIKRGCGHWDITRAIAFFERTSVAKFCTKTA